MILLQIYNEYLSKIVLDPWVNEGISKITVKTSFNWHEGDNSRTIHPERIRNVEMNLQIDITLCQYGIAFLSCDLRD